MAQITLKQIEALVAVADQASFRRAADILHTTQPNISARIAGLESQLGITLMKRDAGSVTLTPAGQRQLDHARQILQAVEGFIGAAGDDALFHGTLRIGVSEMIVHSGLSSYLADLQARFPNIDIDLTVDFSGNLSTSLANQSIDLALHSGPFAQVVSGQVALGAFPMVWVSNTAHDGGSITFAQLTARPLLTHGKGSQIYDQIMEHITQPPDAPARVMASTNLGACLQMAIDGLGVACLPQVMVAGALQSGQLHTLPYPWVPDPLTFSARYHTHTAPNYVVAAAELAKDHF